eukprot:TRINITY_DN6330_c0_g1_i2.p1 TRINITY_DN6330_c0_g1~~TRINITY_DN6330_c0_g1_i2.p1  ORF type:complete len:349 (-),score=60.56 TRINITY_DN6330_c0_g1_i2:192-1238(-)
MKKQNNLNNLLSIAKILKKNQELHDLCLIVLNFLNSNQFPMTFQNSVLLQQNFKLNIPKISITSIFLIMEFKVRSTKRFLLKEFIQFFIVLQGCYSILSITTLSTYMTHLQQYSLLFSALCHDVGHTGHSNAFECNSFSKIALRFNDESVLENYHCSLTFKLLMDSENNFLENLETATFIAFRKNVISNIINTDMSKHFNLLKKFDKKILEKKKNKEDFSQEFKILAGMILHQQDFNANIKPFKIARIWSERVNTEFKNQFNLEGEKGLNQTPFMKDLDKLIVMAKAEMGFIQSIVLPVWKIVDLFLEDNQLAVCIKNLEENKHQWELIYLEEKKKIEEIEQQENLNL